MKILLLDNYDSFTYNLWDYLERLECHCTVIRNDFSNWKQITQQNWDGIVLSPGPQRPKDAGLLMKIVETYYEELPILGICLGHQALGKFFGAKLVHNTVPVHGKTSMILHNQNRLFDNIESPMKVMRYHSLSLIDLPQSLVATAFTENREIMALEHKSLPLFGVQFHPESILTPKGIILLSNWLKIIKNVKN